VPAHAAASAALPREVVMSQIQRAVPALALATFAGAAGAQTVIDFEALTMNNGFVNYVGNQYDEDGFRLSKDPNEPFEFAVFGTQEGRWPGSTALFNDTVGGISILSEANGATFNLVSMKLANLNGPGTVQVSFTGFLSGGGTNVEVFQVNDTGFPLVLQEVTFAGMTDVTRVEWSQDGPFHQFDDITIGGGCYPDCDTTTGQGVLDIFDFLCFQNRFDAGSAYACDCDTSTGPGVCDIFDFLCFQNAFDAGCP
jgi:hypothetical protein